MKKIYKVCSGADGCLTLSPDVAKALGVKGCSDVTVTVKNGVLTVDVKRDNRRKKWVDKWYQAWLLDLGATYESMGVISAVHNAKTDRIGISKPSKTDKYDETVGIAVAYAKSCDEIIPDYI